MLTWIATALVLLWILYKGRNWQQGDTLFWGISFTVLVFGFMTVLSVGYNDISDGGGDDLEVSGRESHTLVSLEDSVQGAGEFSGSFFIGSGAISGKYGPVSAYTWYQKEKGGVLRQITIADDDSAYVLIHEGHQGEPTVVRTTYHDPCPDSPWLTPFTNLCSNYGPYEVGYDLFVPKGTILRTLSLGPEQ